VLLVDDDPDEFMFMQRVLQRCEIDIDLRPLPDGADLLDCLQGAGGYTEEGPLRPDLILLDLNMPKLDGLSTIPRVKAEEDLRNIPIVVLTTSDRDSDVAGAYSAGASSFITKPTGLDGLLALGRALFSYWFEIVHLPTRASTRHELGLGAELG
jgi:CheY-like chemotaxis protein